MISSSASAALNEYSVMPVSIPDDSVNISEEYISDWARRFLPCVAQAQGLSEYTTVPQGFSRTPGRTACCVFETN